jgi:hypothetical protein
LSLENLPNRLILLLLNKRHFDLFLLVPPIKKLTKVIFFVDTDH